MRVSYDEFIRAFLAKIQEYEFLHLPEPDRDAVVLGYMKRAAAKFAEVCVYDIANGDNLSREYTFEGATDMEVDEIVDIVSDGMVVQWLRSYLYRQDNLEILMNTVDFTSYSPAELLKQVRTVYADARTNFINIVNEYSYRHGDLTDLHL